MDNWSQNAVCRILTNDIYEGKIINGKEEITYFLTGQRKEKDESEWLVTIQPKLCIIEDEVFDKAQDILKGRYDSFKITHNQHRNKYQFVQPIFMDGDDSLCMDSIKLRQFCEKK